MKLAFLGFGTIGRLIYTEITSGNLTGINAIAVKDPQLSTSDIKKLGERKVSICYTVDQLIQKLPDIILEAANQEVAKECTPIILSKGINVLSLTELHD